MVPIMQPFMDVESSRSYVDELYSNDMDKCLQAIICLKNSVIGSNRQKGTVISQGVVPRLIHLLSDPNIPDPVKIQATVTLGSLAKGTDEHIKALVDFGVVPHLLNGLVSNDVKLVEYCLCCLRSIFKSQHAPVDLLYYDENLTSHLLSLALQSVSNQVCVTTVLATACKTAERQALLCSQGAVGTLAALLLSSHYKVQMPTLCCLANITFQNPVVSSVVATTSYNGKSIPELVVALTGRSRPTDVQLAAAKVLANLQRAGAIPANDSKILYRALPCLVRLCKEDCPPAQRVEAAETLAFLTEVDMELQRLASISNHLIPTLAGLLRGMPLASDHKLSQDMKQAAFRAFASLGANDEDIRKRIIDTDNLMQHVVAGLEEPSPGVQLAAVRCLHSLSRSVQQLRTTFQDHRVWQPLMQLLKGDDDILTVASSTLCNLLLEFSPSKEPILESGAIDLLCDLTRRPDPALRLNGIWALMNMAFQAEQKIKSQILVSLGTDQIFRLLSDSEVSVLMKTLGLLRNLLSTKPHIDHIMSLHAIQIMQAVILILEGSHSAEVKEQALCILANIADGDSAKDYIMANEDVLKKLTDYMMHSNVKLQIAAVYCISNLVWREDAGASERQVRLKDMGVYKLLQQLIMTSDTALFDKVKTAMTQFSEA
ncbi:Sperm-associated antigen, putative [Pediculus humanus corporis]|uniref:Armadillo repeat-containing protein 8 n=1 Tax=Pediculus humanus subsp. corporis TaxID=121224 RepID=E0VGJ9_PEDHC|nr:Sperm-associated antigen, putative [Pediculus humanus corporis]EEB12505.1 Sperm-associated antigen, putative [Pediculus humanus corporis]